jgi:large subunit ribosomal protein L22
MEFRASHKYARISARKARLVADLIRGSDVNEALVRLRFTRKRACAMVEKVVSSALASAKNLALERRLDVDPNALVVAEALVNEGPTIKRWKPRARGMASPIFKRTCHIEVVLRPAPEAKA